MLNNYPRDRASFFVLLIVVVFFSVFLSDYSSSCCCCLWRCRSGGGGDFVCFDFIFGTCVNKWVDVYCRGWLHATWINAPQWCAWQNNKTVDVSFLLPEGILGNGDMTKEGCISDRKRQTFKTKHSGHGSFLFKVRLHGTKSLSVSDVLLLHPLSNLFWSLFSTRLGLKHQLTN